MTETFVKERTHAATGKVQPVGIDDAAAVLTRFANGSLGTFESTRYARGHKALYTLEINGEHGSLAWDLHDLNRLAWFDHRTEGAFRGWTSILVTDGEHPYLGKWWVPGLIIGFEHSFVHTMADFIAAHGQRHPRRPDLPRRAGDQPHLRRDHRLRQVRRLADPLNAHGRRAPPARYRYNTHDENAIRLYGGYRLVVPLNRLRLSRIPRMPHSDGASDMTSPPTPAMHPYTPIRIHTDSIRIPYARNPAESEA